ncbi:MAG: hypothetical protein ACREQ5_31695, partial [Candidatus Dormibacteria bacterium]
PVPLRPVPQQPWGRIILGVVALTALLVSGWEGYWRSYGVTPGITNSNGLWAIQRRRIDNGEGAATVVVSDSRLFFDLQLPVWEKLDGKRPIQLGMEGTSALIFLEDLAADPKFTGRLLVGVSPQIFFGGFGFRADALKFYRKESPSQRIGQWLSMHLIEPYLAFDDPDFALGTVLARQPWPPRPGSRWPMAVRKLAVTEADRNTHVWSKVENDPDYRALMRKVWLHDLALPGPPPPKQREIAAQLIERAVKAVHTLQARGVKVLFVRPSSTGPYLEYDNRNFPRKTTWDVLLARSGAPGIHFEDYPQLQGLDQPEWSHLSHAAAERFTAALYGIITRDFWKPAAAAAPAAANTSR